LIRLHAISDDCNTTDDDLVPVHIRSDTCGSPTWDDLVRSTAFIRSFTVITFLSNHRLEDIRERTCSEELRVLRYIWLSVLLMMVTSFAGTNGECWRHCCVLRLGRCTETDTHTF